MATKNQISLRVKAIVDGLQDIDKLIAEIDKLGGEAGETGDEAQHLNNQFAQLEKQQKAIAQLNKLNGTISKTSVDLKKARTDATALGKAMATAEKPTKALANEFERARTRVQRLKEMQAAQLTTLKAYSNRAKAAGVDTKRLAAEQVRLADATAKIKSRISSISGELKKTRDGYRSTGTAAKRFGADGAAAGKTARAGVKSISDQLSLAKTQFLSFFGARYAAGMVKDLATVADEWKNITARLDIATDSQEELAAAQEVAFQIAQDARTSMADVANLYSRLTVSLKDHNITQRETADLTETIAKAMQISGASATETSATITQLNQAFASGVLRGTEFNSVMEQGPRLAKALADGMGLPVSALRSMADAGEISAKRVMDALLGQSEAIKSEYETLPLTIEGSVVRLENAWTRFIGQQDQAAGASSKVAEGLSAIAEHLDEIAAAALVVGEVMLAAFAVKGVKAIKTYIKSAKLGATVTLGIGAAAKSSSDKVGLLEKAANLMGAAFVGWEIGKYLREEFEVARIAGIALVDGLVTGAEKVRGGWEIAKAAFTDDTMEAALERHQKRLAEISKTFNQMYIDAAKGADGQRDLADATREVAEGFTEVEKAAAALEEPLTNIEEKSAAITKQFKDLGFNLEEITSGLSTDVKNSLDAIALAMENPALEGKALLRFLDEVLDKSNHPKVLAAAIDLVTNAFDKGVISAEELTAATDRLEEAQRKHNQATKEGTQETLKHKVASQDLTVQMYDLAASYRRGEITARDFYRTMRQLSTAAAAQRAAAAQVVAGNQAIASSANQAANAVVQGEQRAASARSQGMQNFQNFWQNVRNTYHSVSASIGKQYDDMIARLGRTTQSYQTSLRLLSMWLKKLDRQAKDYALSAQGYGESLTGVIRQASQAIANMKVLDGQKLSQLRQQIGAARAALRSLNDAARDTLSSLRQELASLQGDVIGAEVLRYQQQREDLEAALENAIRNGARDAANYYRQALETLAQIHRQRMATLREEQAAAGNSTNPVAAPLPEQRNDNGTGLANNLVEVRFNMGQGLSTSTGYFTEDGLGTFLQQLEDAGATTE